MGCLNVEYYFTSLLRVSMYLIQCLHIEGLMILMAREAMIQHSNHLGQYTDLKSSALRKVAVSARARVFISTFSTCAR